MSLAELPVAEEGHPRTLEMIGLEPMITAFREGTKFTAIIPKGLEPTPEYIEEEGVLISGQTKLYNETYELDSKSLDSKNKRFKLKVEINDSDFTVLTYCPKALYQNPDGSYEVCRALCYRKGNREKVCSDGKHSWCATYDPHRADYNEPKPAETKINDSSEMIDRRFRQIFGNPTSNGNGNGNGNGDGKKPGCISESFR